MTSDSLVDGEESDIIFSLGTSTLKLSHGFVLETRRVIFNPVNKTSIPSIRIYITDGLRRPVYFNNACADTSISLILKEILIDNYMKTRDFKKQLSPNFGNVYEHTGDGLIVDNILKPIYEHRGNGLIVNNILKPIKSG